MQYDSTIKLWDATRKTSTLYQNLPHTIFYGNELSTANYFKLRRLEIPCTLKQARKEFRDNAQKFHGVRADENLLKWNFDLNRRRRLLKILRIASFVVPKSITKSNSLNRHIRHSLQTELLKNVETNCNNMGLITATEDYSFRDVIRKFQQPTEINLPLSFTTCYKTSLYSMKPTTLIPATMLDSEPTNGNIKKSAGVEFNFIIQDLVTAWVTKYDRVHDFWHHIPMKTVLPENTNLDKIIVRRSSSNWARMLRNDSGNLSTQEEVAANKWKGKRNFNEINLHSSILKTRRNATSTETAA